MISESQYGHHDVDELVQMLAEAQSLDEQGDILHYLVVCYGLGHTISLAQSGETVSVRELLRTLYEAACSKKNWGIVRHSAGFLGKRVEDLSKSVTDLLVRQKQVSGISGELLAVACFPPTVSCYNRDWYHTCRVWDKKKKSDSLLANVSDARVS